MIKLVQRLGDRTLRLFVPQREAGACLCGPGDAGYEYRCSSAHNWQKRWCSYNCNCVKSCGSWQTVITGACPD